jgi:tetratricopeptide (TPR) repeat protein
LAYYLRGQFDKAAAEYARCAAQMGQDAGPALPGGAKRCADMVNDADSRIGLMEWRYRALRRAKRDEEAERLLETVPEGLEMKESDNYYQCLLFYRGQRTEKSLLDPAQLKGNAFATLGYAVANYYLTEGNPRKACPLLRKVAQDPAWNAFGAIAAETEINRGVCKDE